MKLFNKKNAAVKDASQSKSVKKSSSKSADKVKPALIGKHLQSWSYQPGLIVVFATVLLYFMLDFLFIQDAETQAQNELKTVLSTTVNQNLELYIKEKSSGVLSLSKTDEIRQALFDPDKSKQFSDLIGSVWDDLEHLYPISREALSSIGEHYPELSFASVDLLRRSISGQDTKVEAFFHQGAWHFQIAAPVKHKRTTPDVETIPNGKVESSSHPLLPSENVGVLLATFKLSFIKDLLKISPVLPPGEMAIVTTQGTKDQLVVSQGVASQGTGDTGQSVYVPTIVSQWRIRYSPSVKQLPVLDRTLVWLILGGVGVILVVLITLVCRLNINHVRHDMLLMSKYIKKVIMGEGRVPSTFIYGEFYSLMMSLREQIPTLLKNLKGSASLSGSENSNGAKTNTLEPGTIHNSEKTNQGNDSPLFDDDLLDLYVLSEVNSAQDETNSNSNFEGNNESMVTEVAQLDLDVSQSIFRAYDIRGVVDDTLNEGVVELLGKAIASEALSQGQKTLCVGYDGRLSSVTYCEALTKGIISTGIDAIIIGQVPTPVLYFSTHHFETGSGVMITGSHNPSNYNGFKMMLAGKTLSGDDIQKLYNRIILQDFEEGHGSRTEESVDQHYLDIILNDIAVAAPLKVVLDAGNGVAGGIAPLLIEELGCEVIPLFCEVDGNFPNHHPDPGKPENLQDLIAAVKEHDADIGLAFDGDGDRLGVVTNEGKIIWPDRLLMLFAKDVVSRNPGADIIFDVKCSRRLNGLISGYGGRPIMWKTGHSLIKAKMQETGALLAGEMSGHVFFKERWFGFDDGLYSAARLLEILGVEDRTSDEVFADFPEDISTPEINITVTDESKFEIVEKLCERKDEFVDGNVSTIDGLRVDYPNGWGLCRASNTTPVLVLRFEADDETSLQEIKDKFITQLKLIDSSLNCDF